MLGIIKLYLIILFYDLYIVGGISLNRHRNSLFRNSLGFISSQYYNINRRNNSKSLSSKLDENNEFHSDEFEFTTDFNDYLKFMEASGYYISVVKNEPMKELYIRERITKYPLRIVVKDELNKIKGFDSLNPWTEIYAKGSLGFDRECRNDYFSGCYILIDSENPDHKLEFIYNSQNELKGSNMKELSFDEDISNNDTLLIKLVNLLNKLRMVHNDMYKLYNEGNLIKFCPFFGELEDDTDVRYLTNSDVEEINYNFLDFMKYIVASGYYISVVKNEPMKELYIRERITKYPLRIVVKDELNKIKGFDSLNPWTEIYAKGSLGFDRECRNDYFSGCYILIDSENPDHKLEFIYNSQNELKGSFASHDFHEDMNHKSSSYLHLVNLLNHLRDNKLILSKIEDELIGPDGDDSHIKDKKYKKKLNSDFKKRANACKTLIKIIDAMLQLRGANYKVVKENLYEIINEFRVLIKPTYFTPDWELQLK